MTTIAQLDALIDELTTDAYGDDEQLTGFLTGAEEALRRGEPAQIVGVDLDVLAVNAGPDLRTGLTARVGRGGATYEVGLADLRFPTDSELGVVVAAYRRWLGRPPHDRWLEPARGRPGSRSLRTSRQADQRKPAASRPADRPSQLRAGRGRR